MTAPPLAAFTPAELAAFTDPVCRFWHALHDLRDLGAEHKALTARLATLEGQLADETRGTPEQREKAMQRAQNWRDRLELIEGEAHLVRLGIASLYHRLPVAEKRTVRERFGLEAATPAPVMAAWVWQRATAGEAIPGLAPW